MSNPPDTTTPLPNILLITCDQYQFPRFSYGDKGGFVDPLKQILGFQGEIGEDNPYAKFFPGLLRLRKNAVVLRNHTIAASACTPSRSVIYTGQYGTRTGVTQTDGLFKNGDAANFPWLNADGIPTLGDWMRQAGYSTHYFGKWHVSNPPEHSLKRYGFDDWEPSYPEPHGSQPNNLGIYRDVGFTDSACAFLRRQGLAGNYNRVYASMLAADPSSAGPDVNKIKPWFAVASFTNPHDIATYPGVIAQALPVDPDTLVAKHAAANPPPLPPGVTLPPATTQPMFGPLTIPKQHEQTPPPIAGTMTIPLNPLDFPQACSHLPPTWNESLADKPSCQADYAYKMGLALGSKAGFNIVAGIQSALANATPPKPPLSDEKALELAVALGLQSCIPFQLTENPAAQSLLFIQFYAWLHAVVDVHIEAVLKALDESGQADNTIVVFLTDHGEYASAHGMMLEKWHTAYQEALHVPVVVRFPQPRDPKKALAKHEATGVVGPLPAQIDAVTSHVDIIPTILGLAGIGNAQRDTIRQTMSASRPVPPLPGADLAPVIASALNRDTVVIPILEPDGQERKGVLFITDDEITNTLPFQYQEADERSLAEFQVYKATVEAVRHGTPNTKAVPSLVPGSVRQPNHVRCVRTMDYKLARYFDPSGKEAQEWEMYDLVNDPNETTNLVSVNGSPPKAASALPTWTTTQTVQKKADELDALLHTLELKYLM